MAEKRDIQKLEGILKAREAEIDALKKANADLVRKRAGQEAAEKLAGIGHWERNLDESSVKWSEGIRHIFGITPKDVPREFERYLDFVHPDDRLMVKNEVETCMFARKRMDLEYRIFRKDGRQRSVRAIADSDWGEEGQSRKMFGTIQDITAAREAETRFRALFQYSLNAIFLVNENGRHMDANPAATRMTGYEKEKLISMKVWDLCPPERVEQVKKAWRQFCSLKNMSGLFVIQTRNKEEVFANFHAVSHILPNTHMFVLMDVTQWKKAEDALRESEMMYRHIVESLNEGIWELDDKGVTRFVTPQMARLLGLKTDEMAGRHFFDFIPGQKIPEAKHYLAKGRSGIQEQHDFEFTKKDKTSFHALMESVPIFNEQGDYEGVIASVLDISERKQEEKRKDLALDMLRILNRSQSGWDLVNQILSRVKNYADFYRVNILLADDTASPNMPHLFGVDGEVVLDEPDAQLMDAVKNHIFRTGKTAPGYKKGHRRRSWFPFYTPAGSFWTNSTTALLSEAMISENPAKMVRLVNKQGYESMAIVPLSSERKTIGALVIRDPGKDRFKLDDIYFFEGVGDSVGLAIEREQTVLALKKSEMEWANTFNAIHDWVTVVDRNHRVIKSNRRVTDFFKPPPDGVVGQTCCRLLYGAHRVRSDCPMEKMLVTKKRESIEQRLDNGTWIQVTADPLMYDEHKIVGAVHIVRDITFRKKSEEALNHSMALLRAMAVRVSEVEETERKQLARELHDRVGQNLAALNLNLTIIRNGLTKGPAAGFADRLTDSIKLVEETTDSIREVMNELRPEFLDDFGMLATLNRYAEIFSKRTKIRVTVTGDELDPRPPRIHETSLLRIAQESLNNVAKHSSAERVWIRLEDKGGIIRLEIKDNGRGFDVEKTDHLSMPEKWGLVSMRERACALGGKVTVRSASGAGTAVIARLKR